MKRPRTASLPVSVLAHDGQHIDDGQMLREVVGRVVENGAHRVVGAAHDALHAIDRAQKMRAVDAHDAAGADENILVVVGHADHLVRHHLADGEDEVVAAVAHELVHLRGPLVVELDPRSPRA